MFTGIVETVGRIEEIYSEQKNITFRISSEISSELKIDQSIAHDGVCLTVTAVDNGWHEVTAIHETLIKTSLGTWRKGHAVNLERCLRLGDRLDGHMVQGHVDCIAHVTSLDEDGGSWRIAFAYDEQNKFITVSKGSICVNGTSLTVVDSAVGRFSVAIIPYTWNNTNFRHLQIGDIVNLEFDILGKYILEYLKYLPLASQQQ
jgi:riboflavin synthase